MVRKTDPPPAGHGKMPETVSAATLARIIGVTPRRLNSLVDEGVLEMVGRGAYRTAESVQAYIKFKIKGSERSVQSASAESLRDARSREISLRIAQRERDLIPIGEAIETIDEVTGEFLTSLNTLPAMISGVLRERQRLETIFDTERLRLTDKFAKSRKALVSGKAATEAEPEDDA